MMFVSFSKVCIKVCIKACTIMILSFSETEV